MSIQPVDSTSELDNLFAVSKAKGGKPVDVERRHEPSELGGVVALSRVRRRSADIALHEMQYNLMQPESGAELEWH